MEIKDITNLMHDFVKSKGWYDEGSLRHQTLRNLATSLSIEAAEVLEHFQWKEEIDDKDGLSNELADVALYLLQLSSIAGIDLEKAILKKIEINKTRSWNNT